MKDPLVLRDGPIGPPLHAGAWKKGFPDASVAAAQRLRADVCRPLHTSVRAIAKAFPIMHMRRLVMLDRRAGRNPATTLPRRHRERP